MTPRISGRVVASVLALLCGARAGLTQEIAAPRQVYDGAMTPDLEVRTFARSDELFPVRLVEKGNSARPLPMAKTAVQNVRFESGGEKDELFDYFGLNRVAGVLILKNCEGGLRGYELMKGASAHWPATSIGEAASLTLIVGG